MDKKRFILKNDESIELSIVNILINGEEREIIPAFSKFSVARSNLNKTKEILNPSKILPSLFVFTEPKIFRTEKHDLFDYNGVVIPEELDNQVLVYGDKADNINLWDIITEPLKSEIISCQTVGEFYQAIASTFACSQVPRKNDWTGICEATTSDNIFSDVREFSNENKLAGTVSLSYFGVNLTLSDLKKSAIVMSTPFNDGETFRSKAEAKKLFSAVSYSIGKKAACQTRYIKGINPVIDEYSIDEVLLILNKLDSKSKKRISDAPSHLKSGMVTTILTKLCEKNRLDQDD